MEQHWSVAAVILLMLTSLLASLEERHRKHICLSEIKMLKTNKKTTLNMNKGITM